MAAKRAASASRRTKPLRGPKPARKNPVPATRATPAAAGSAAPVSPLAPQNFVVLPPLSGWRLATGAAAIRYPGRTDTMLAVLAAGTQVAGLFTTSKAPSAPVDWCRTQLPHKSVRALVANSGNANAFTGAAGRDA